MLNHNVIAGLFAIAGLSSLVVAEEWEQFSALPPTGPTQSCVGFCDTIIFGGHCPAGTRCCGWYKCSTGQTTNLTCCTGGQKCVMVMECGLPTARCVLQF